LISRTIEDGSEVSYIISSAGKGDDMNDDRYIVLDHTGQINYKATYERCKQILSEEKFKVTQLKMELRAQREENLEANRLNRILVDRLLNQSSQSSSPRPTEPSIYQRSNASTPTIPEKSENLNVNLRTPTMKNSRQNLQKRQLPGQNSYKARTHAQENRCKL
jgi:hypothetical protein